MDYRKTNGAVIKSLFLQMDKPTFIRHAQELKAMLLTMEISPETMNYRIKLLRIYCWCRVVYRSRF